MSVPTTIPANDKKNPTYYKMRAGYPHPTENWYFGEDDTSYTKPHYTNEKFFTSFNMKLCHFYAAREHVAIEIAKRGLYHCDWKDVAVKTHLFEMYDKLREQRMLLLTGEGRCWLILYMRRESG